MLERTAKPHAWSDKRAIRPIHHMQQPTRVVVTAMNQLVVMASSHAQNASAMDTAKCTSL